MDSGQSAAVHARVVVCYAGRVQGVGFRATAREVSRSFAVCGQVKNLDDGRVELIAEGERAELDAFLAAIRLRMKALLRSESVEWAQAQGSYTGFQIAH